MAAPVQAQNTSNTASASSVTTATPAAWTNNTTANSLLVCVVTTRTSSTTVHSVSGWTQIGGMIANAGGSTGTSMATSVWWKKATGGTKTELPVATWSGARPASIMCQEFTGANTTSLPAAQNNGVAAPVRIWKVLTDNTYGQTVAGGYWNNSGANLDTQGIFAGVGFGLDVTQTANGTEDQLICQWLAAENTSGTTTAYQVPTGPGSSVTPTYAPTGTTGAPRIVQYSPGGSGTVTSYTQTAASFQWANGRIWTIMAFLILPTNALNRGTPGGVAVTEAQAGSATGAGAPTSGTAAVKLTEAQAGQAAGTGAAAPSSSSLTEAQAGGAPTGTVAASTAASLLSEALSSPESAATGTPGPSPTQISLTQSGGSGAGAIPASPQAVQLEEDTEAQAAARAGLAPTATTIKLDLSAVRAKAKGIPGSVTVAYRTATVRGRTKAASTTPAHQNTAPTIRAKALNRF